MRGRSSGWEESKEESESGVTSDVWDTLRPIELFVRKSHGTLSSGGNRLESGEDNVLTCASVV